MNGIQLRFAGFRPKLHAMLEKSHVASHIVLKTSVASAVDELLEQFGNRGSITIDADGAVGQTQPKGFADLASPGRGSVALARVRDAPTTRDSTILYDDDDLDDDEPPPSAPYNEAGVRRRTTAGASGDGDVEMQEIVLDDNVALIDGDKQ